jgi:hypothetical protein
LLEKVAWRPSRSVIRSTTASVTLGVAVAEIAASSRDIAVEDDHSLLGERREKLHGEENG